MANNTKTKKLPIVGHEADVQYLRTMLAYFKIAEQDVAARKQVFRDLAESAASTSDVDGITTLSFQDGSGGSIDVSLPDYSKAGNRLSLSPETLAAAEEAGVALETEMVESYTLSGPWAEWFKTVLASFESQGVTMPEDGCSHKVVTKLTADGAVALRAHPAAASAKIIASTLSKAKVEAK